MKTVKRLFSKMMNTRTNSDMDEEDKATITRNLVELINQTNLEELLPKLLQRGVFTAAMCEKYMYEMATLSERKRNLYLDLQRQGPDTFQKLVDSLQETGHRDLVRLLGRTTPLKVEVVLATQRRDIATATGPQVYRMISKPRGLMLMINNVQFFNGIMNTRVGSEVDEENFESLFTQMGFVVEKYRDEGYEDMKCKIRNFAQRQEHRKYDCCVMAIMSHGDYGCSKQDSTIISADGQHLQVDWVLDQFSNNNAESLIDKPKIFFFQACRGNYMNMRFLMNSIQQIKLSDEYPAMVVSSVSDTLICYSTLPGYTSNSDPKLGTWYIQTICEVFMKYAHALDIEDMLKMVNEKMETLTTGSGHMQMSMYENKGFWKLFFNPGLYDDGSQTALA